MKIEPKVHIQLDRMNGLQRATASFCHILLCGESWISPNNEIRAWVKANARFAMFMAAPTVIAFPVVTVTLWEVSSWVSSLTTIAGKLIFLPVLVLLALISISIIFKTIRVFRP